MQSLQNDVAIQRKVRNLTQSQLASTVGVTRQTIAAIEKGDYSPSAILAFQLAELLGVVVHDLFWLEETTNE